MAMCQTSAVPFALTSKKPSPSQLSDASPSLSPPSLFPPQPSLPHPHLSYSLNWHGLGGGELFYHPKQIPLAHPAWNRLSGPYRCHILVTSDTQKPKLSKIKICMWLKILPWKVAGRDPSTKFKMPLLLFKRKGHELLHEPEATVYFLKLFESFILHEI